METSLFGINFSELQSGFYDIAYYIIWAVVLLIVFLFAWFHYQNKKIYIYNVRIFRRRSNGAVKEINKKGGYITKKGMIYFAIKMKRFKSKTLERVPDSGLMDEEDRLYFYQLSPEAPLIQCKRNFNIEKILIKDEKFVEPSEEEVKEQISRRMMELKLKKEYKEKSEDELYLVALSQIEKEIDLKRNTMVDITNVYYTPIPTDQKRQALSDIQRFREALGVDVNKQFLYFVIGVIALVVLGAIIFYVAVNKGDVPIVTDFFPLLFLKRKGFYKKFK